jgi:hypothetical protein
MKIRPVGAEFFQEDGRTDGWTDRATGNGTDMTKLTAAFVNFADTPKNSQLLE